VDAFRILCAYSVPTFGEKAKAASFRACRFCVFLWSGSVGVQPYSICSSCAVASDCIPGATWLYTSMVSVVELCPRRSATTLG